MEGFRRTASAGAVARWLAPVLRSFGRLSVVLMSAVLTSFGLFMLGGPAQAAGSCTCAQQQSIAEAASAADDVFTGTVVAREVTRRGSVDTPRVFTYRVGLTRVVQARAEGQLGGTVGQEVDGQVVAVTGKQFEGACDPLPLKTNQRYLFFAADDGQLRLASGCTGTRMLDAQVLTELDQDFPTTPPAPVEQSHPVHRTKVADSAPVAFTRLASPGAALVILGALGLAVVRRIARED